MKLSLNGKRALITGGTKGIGKAIVLALAKEGCSVAFFGRDFDRVRKLHYCLKAMFINRVNTFIGKCFDIEKGKNKVDEFMDVLVGDWGGIDILINNVGGLGSVDEARTWDMNFGSMDRFTQKCIPYMQKNKWGRIITISSIYGREAGGVSKWFAASKAAQIVYMKSLSQKKEYVRNGITFNTICPGHVSCGYSYEKNKDSITFKKMVDDFPMGKVGTPEDVANVVIFLCSEKSSRINGTSIVVDGGESKSF